MSVMCVLCSFSVVLRPHTREREKSARVSREGVSECFNNSHVVLSCPDQHTSHQSTVITHTEVYLSSMHTHHAWGQGEAPVDVRTRRNF